MYKIYPSEVDVDTKGDDPGPGPPPPGRLAAQSQEYRVPMPLGENIKIDQEDHVTDGDLSSLEELFLMFFNIILCLI